jgi:membrane associated rhomboid family serine protease
MPPMPASRPLPPLPPLTPLTPPPARRRTLALTTWLIVINCAVFLLNNVMLAGHPVRCFADAAPLASATPEQWARRQLDERFTFPDPQRGPGYFYHPLVDRQTRVVDPVTGRPVLDPNAQPIYQPVGRRWLTFRPPLDCWGHFSTGKAFMQLEVWRFITFQFLHGSIWHLVFNMLGLYFVGWMVEDRLGTRRFAAFYLACGICGAGLYLLLNVAAISLASLGIDANVPALLFADPYTTLVGASAGVFGVLMAAAFLRPRETVYIFFAVPMKLKYAVYIFLGLAAVNLLAGGPNAGGDAAHVGGAIAGALFIRHPAWLRDFFDEFVRPEVPLAPPPHTHAPGDSTQDEDPLEKVDRSGLSSLTQAERDALARAGRQLGGRGPAPTA